jgi:hypothetical protein
MKRGFEAMDDADTRFWKVDGLYRTVPPADQIIDVANLSWGIPAADERRRLAARDLLRGEAKKSGGDFYFITRDGKRVGAHKHIIAEASDMFRCAVYNEDFKDQREGFMRVECTASVLESLLTLIYFGGFFAIMHDQDGYKFSDLKDDLRVDGCHLYAACELYECNEVCKLLAGGVCAENFFAAWEVASRAAHLRGVLIEECRRCMQAERNCFVPSARRSNWEAAPACERWKECDLEGVSPAIVAQALDLGNQSSCTTSIYDRSSWVQKSLNLVVLWEKANKKSWYAEGGEPLTKIVDFGVLTGTQRFAVGGKFKTPKP